MLPGAGLPVGRLLPAEARIPLLTTPEERGP